MFARSLPHKCPNFFCGLHQSVKHQSLCMEKSSQASDTHAFPGHNKQSIGKTHRLLFQNEPRVCEIPWQEGSSLSHSNISMGCFSCLAKMLQIRNTHLMALKMTPYDIALAAQVIASFKTDVHRVTVAGVPEVFGQYYYSQGQSSSATRTRGQCGLHLNFLQADGAESGSRCSFHYTYKWNLAFYC